MHILPRFILSFHFCNRGSLSRKGWVNRPISVDVIPDGESALGNGRINQQGVHSFCVSFKLLIFSFVGNICLNEASRKYVAKNLSGYMTKTYFEVYSTTSIVDWTMIQRSHTASPSPNWLSQDPECLAVRRFYRDPRAYWPAQHEE